MSAKMLREAAKVLRNRAKAATTGPWRYVNTEVLGDGTPFGDVRDPKGQRVGDSDDEGSAFILFDGVYVATMHPGVGLATAAVLDALATDVETLESAEGRRLNDATLDMNLSAYPECVDLARRILGGDS